MRQTPATMTAVLLLAACGSQTTGPGYLRSSGSLAISADSKQLYVADQDNDALVVVDPAKGAVVGTVKVGHGPVWASVAPDGRVFVANRFDRSVSVVDPSKLSELTRLPVGAEPVGLAFSGDGRTLLVVNNTSRSLTFVDVRSLAPMKEVSLAADPTGVTVAGGEAYVSYARSPEVSVVDVAGRKVLDAKAMSLSLAKDQTGGDARTAGQAVAAVFDPSRRRLYVPHVQSKTDLVPTEVGSTDAYVGQPGTIPVVASALATVDTTNDRVLPGPALQAGGCGDCAMPDAPVPPGREMAPPAAPVSDVPSVLRFAAGPLAGPSAAVLDPSGDWLYVTNVASSNVSVIALASGETDLAPVKVGHGPTGIALDGSGKTAFVYNSFDHTISVLAGESGEVVATRTFSIGQSSLTPEEELGRRLFYAADDARMTNPASGGIACASCHPGGREDGRTWQFSEGPRNTPTLAGRDLAKNPPYHWDGSIKDMPGFRVVVETRMGGSGMQATSNDPLTDSDFDAILAYLQALPAPDNPHRAATLPAPAARGKALFEGKAACVACHTGPDHTDRQFHDVGTIGVAQDGSPEQFPSGVVTPPLNNLFNTAPYLHNGSAATLRDRLTHNPGDRHGFTSGLSSSQLDDLVAYLKTL